MTRAHEIWPSSVVGATIGGRYHVEALLGAGGMGAVFEGVHQGTGRHVAIKLLTPTLKEHPKAIKRFQLEARAAASTGRRGVVDVLDYDVDPVHGHYLVMERLEGESLQDRIDRGRLEPREAFSIAVEILDTLSAVHDHGIVHRDLKPANVFLSRTEEGETVVKILDFGISRVTAADTSTKLTAPGMAVGTPRYMAPEQARCDPDVDRRADLYSVGAILYEALSGVKPYGDASPGTVLAEVVMRPPTPLREITPGLPEAVYEVVDWSMKRERSERFQTAEEASQALIASLEGRHIAPSRPREAPKRDGAGARSRGAATRPPDRGASRGQRRSPASRRGLIIMLAAVAILGAVGVVIVSLYIGSRLFGETAPSTPTPLVAGSSATSTPGPGIGLQGANSSPAMTEVPSNVLEQSLQADLEAARREHAVGQNQAATARLRQLLENATTNDVRPETREGQIVAEAHLTLSTLNIAALTTTPLHGQASSPAETRQLLAAHYSEAMAHDSAARRFSPALAQCAITADGEATEQMGAVHDELRRRSPPRLASGDGDRAALDVIRSYYRNAQQFYDLALTTSPAQAECATRARAGQQRIARRLAELEAR